MSAEAVIHAWWADATDALAVALNTLLPVAKVATGTQFAEADDAIHAGLPFASLNRESSNDAYRTNCGRTDNTLIRLQIWHEIFDAGNAIKEAAIACFDNREYATSDRQIVSIRRSNDFNLQEDDGVWQFLIDFIVVNRAL